ncbi:MAG: type IV secretion system DNA-binding domain-containing protein [Patescibacteria group bacterium]|nr:type IV secretion system DNA-binding domain-containing protein [Patescibacteria group bacterium]
MPLDYNHDHENEITLFAETNFRNAKRRFGIKTDDRRRHIYIIGKTGMGKTTLIENMVLSDILAGHGVCYVDPHGDTAEKLLDYIPSNRINDVVYFNPSDLEYPVGFNILETVEDDKKHLVASGLMGVFKKIWPDVWSARMEYILQNCVNALLDYPGATLLGINRLLVDPEYRKRVIAKIRDPIVKTFWVAEFSAWSEKYATEAIAPVQNKVGQFLSVSVIRNIVAQVKSTIDPLRIMDEGKILIVNLSKGKIGEDNMRLLGGMMITKLQMAAMERVNIPEPDRRDFYLYVDEFQNFANESFASILSEARKYRLNLVVAHQYIKQLDEKVAWAVFGNVGTIVTFRVGADDAMFMENEFTPTYTPEDLVNLAKYEVYLKLMVDGAATTPFSANTLAPIAQRTGSEQKVIAVSRERYAAVRSLIEEKVLRWSGMELTMGNKLEYPAIKTAEEMEEAGDTSGRTQAEQGIDELEGSSDNGEYLKISDERMASFAKPQQQGKKKDKPMFSHTCNRCGKVWEMPVQLDPSRPIFCAECLPIIREERNAKQAVQKNAFRGPRPGTDFKPLLVEDVEPAAPAESKLVETFRRVEGTPETRTQQPSGAMQNKPRISGEPRSYAPPKGTVRIVEGGGEDEDGLMKQLMQGRTNKVETNKDKLISEAPRNFQSRPEYPQPTGQHKKKRHKNRSSDERPIISSSSSPEKRDELPESIMTQPSATVFRRTVSSVNGETRQPQTDPEQDFSRAFEVEVSRQTNINPLDKRLAHGKIPGASGQTRQSQEVGDDEGGGQTGRDNTN